MDSEAGPWTEYQSGALVGGSEEKGPWTEYQSTPQEKNQPSTALDVAKSAGVGLAKGVNQLAGFGGDIQELVHAGAGKIAESLGFPDQPRAEPYKTALPTSGDIQKAEEKFTGPFYQPQTTAGQYAETAGEFLPGAVAMPGSAAVRGANAIRYGVIPGVASEAAGQATKGTEAEPYARAAFGAFGAFAGPEIANAPRRLVTPLPVSDERKAMLDTLEKAGIKSTAGQSSGSRALQMAESTLGNMPLASHAAHETVREQKQQLGGAALREAGRGLSPNQEQIIGATITSNGRTFDAPNHVLAMDKMFESMGDRSLGHIEDGFRTSTGRVVNREEATQIARDAKQLKETPEKMRTEARNIRGLSEDRLSTNINKISDEILADTKRDLGGEYDALASRNVLHPDPQLSGDFQDAVDEYKRLVGPSSQAPGVEKMAADLAQKAASGQPIAGDVYQVWRSQLSKDANGLRFKDPPQAQAYRTMRRALDKAMERSLERTNPAVAGAWKALDKKYSNYKTIDKAYKGTGGVTAAEEGLSPARLRQASYDHNPELLKLSRAAEAILTPLPNSMTGERSHLIHLATQIFGGAAGYGAGGSLGAVLGAVGGPAAIEHVLMSKPIQSYLKNQVAAKVGLPATTASSRGLAAALAAKIGAEHDSIGAP